MKTGDRRDEGERKDEERNAKESEIQEVNKREKRWSK